MRPKRSPKPRRVTSPTPGFGESAVLKVNRHQYMKTKLYTHWDLLQFKTECVVYLLFCTTDSWNYYFYRRRSRLFFLLFLSAHRHLSTQKDALLLSSLNVSVEFHVGTRRKHKAGTTCFQRFQVWKWMCRCAPLWMIWWSCRLPWNTRRASREAPNSGCLPAVTSHCSRTGPHSKYGCAIVCERCGAKPARRSPFTFKPATARKCARYESTFIHVFIVSDAVAWQHPWNCYGNMPGDLKIDYTEFTSCPSKNGKNRVYVCQQLLFSSHLL